MLEAKNMQLIEEDKESKQQIFEAQEKVVEAEKLREEMKEAMDKSINEKINFKIQLDEKREKTEILNEENASLRTKLKEIEEESKKYRKQAKALQKEVEVAKQMELELVAVKNDLQFNQAQSKIKDQDHEESKRSLVTLQRAMTSQYEELQYLKKSKEQQQCAHSSEISQLKEQIEAN